MLKNQDTIMAILRPVGFKSTSMMESNPKTDSIKIFEFEHTALERMNEVVKWEENIAHYKMEYKWRSYEK
jgi:hypothetical protein